MSELRHGQASTRFIERCLRQSPGRLTGLLLGQLDAFNRLAATFGADVSARFCSGYVEGLRRVLPPGASIIRLGNRRFIALLPADTIGAIMDAAAQLVEDERAHVKIDEDEFVVDLTLGVAVYPTHAEDAERLVRRAELALTEARESEVPIGMYTPDSTRRQAALWKLESDLERAIQHRDIEVHFQPKIELADFRVRGFEALARWRTRSGAFVSPEMFVPLAERCGAIVPLTWLVFERVRESLSAWAGHEGSLTLAVNVAPHALKHPLFFDRLGTLHDELRAAGIGLTAELTEESLVCADAASKACLERVRKLGVGLSIDDFGRGYSSLAYLKEIPATEVKIDRRFVSTAAIDEKDRQVVRVIVELARAFGMSAVAEGVDSDAALRAVASLGCDTAQGFFIARSMRADLAARWLRGPSCEAIRVAASAGAEQPASV